MSLLEEGRERLQQEVAALDRFEAWIPVEVLVGWDTILYNERLIRYERRRLDARELQFTCYTLTAKGIERREMLKAALAAAPDPRVGPLVEALGAVLSEFAVTYSMLNVNGKPDFETMDCIQQARAALAAAKGEGAEEPWCNEEEHGYPIHGNRYEVRGHGVMMFIDPPHTHCYWVDNDTERMVAFEGSEWRSATKTAWISSEERMPESESL